MSETTAFLAGSAVAGVAALLVLKGGFSLSQPEVPPPYNPAGNAAEVSPSSISGQLSTQAKTAEDLQTQLKTQQELTEQLKAQLEKQRETTEELKTQLEAQRLEAQRVIDQVKNQQRSMDLLTLQQALPDQANSDLMQTLQNREQSRAQVILLWGLGGIIVVLVVGGGLIVGSLVILLVQQRRAARSAQAANSPLNLPVTYAAPTYNAAYPPLNDLLLPPHVPVGNNATPYYPPNPYYDTY